MISSITFAFVEGGLCIELRSGKECVMERENAWEMNEEKRKGTRAGGRVLSPSEYQALNCYQEHDQLSFPLPP